MRAISVTFRCRNLRKMKRFYTQILGWEVSEEGNNYCYLDTGGLLTMGLIASKPKDWDYPSGSATFLDVEIDDPVTLRSILAVRDVDIVREELTDGAIFLHVQDPEGNIISFFKATSNE
jgi:catechol 2,3-dioxygenase-like lactoylglutathione lyase family enzyme